MLISERIFLLLEEKNISQKDFSSRTGIAQSTISDWKRKKTNPASDKIMIICDVLNVSPYELLSGAEGKNINKLDYVMIDKRSDDYKFIERYRKLSGGKKNRVKGYIQALLGE
ncbi:MAG: helix-turn-helix domain-containing protein [Lachnospiraceae bacterium]|nr:helix-turn-helix domain-containing protein [Lachnospiraceae bacterium]